MITDEALQEALYDRIAARDTRYDDVFFFAVTSTGIYCRPSCPARRPLQKNCRFFTAAEEAEQAGYRACKRCRPAQPAARAVILRLYQTGPGPEGFDAAQTRLAAGTGIGERQFRRLAKATTGKTPAQLARQRRLEYARGLLRYTDVSVAAIAFRAGFQSLRQFNYAFKQSYGLSPAQTRKGKSGHDDAVL